jgi:dTDP-4-amino-4,6-dideoxygalactose transaminase
MVEPSIDIQQLSPFPNRSAFSRGDVDKYEWVDLGASYSPSEIIAAFLYAQLSHIEDIQKERVQTL